MDTPTPSTPIAGSLADSYFRLMTSGTFEKAKIYKYRLMALVIEQYESHIRKFLDMEGSLADLRIPGVNTDEIQTLEGLLTSQ